MAQTKHEIQATLSAAGVQPRKRFGQNFMIDQNIVRLVAEAGQIAPDDVVIEVGPGTGSLTEELLARRAALIAVEIDRDLARVIRERFGSADDIATFVRTLECPQVILIEGDALSGKHGLHEKLLAVITAATRAARPLKLVANLPYNIASPLIVELLQEGVELLAFTVQREVGDRLRAAPGTESYGALTIMTQLLSRVEFLRTIPPQAFWPAPKVESALVRLKRDDRLGNRARVFSQFLQRAFGARRKTLRKALLRAGFEAQDAIAALQIDPQIRGENLSPDQWLGLFDVLRLRREA